MDKNYTSKNILKRSVWYTFKRLIIIAVEIILIVLLINVVPEIEITNYLTWVIYAFGVLVISGLIVFLVEWLVYRNSIKTLIKTIKNMKRIEKYE